MNIYDFDGTIYDGDSSVDFMKFCMKQNPLCLKILPGFALSVMLYLLKRHSKEQLKSAFFRFVTCFDDLDPVIDAFWSEHEGKIKTFYLQQKRDDDMIISASPAFLLQPICDKLGVRLIASDVDPQSGEFLAKNCHGAEKVLRLREVTDESCESFYSDSQSDLPLAELAQRAFLVKGNRITVWK